MTKSKFIKLPCSLENKTLVELGVQDQTLIDANVYIDREDISRVIDAITDHAEEIDSCLVHFYSTEETLWIPLKAEEVISIIDKYDNEATNT